MSKRKLQEMNLMSLVFTFILDLWYLSHVTKLEQGFRMARGLETLCFTLKDGWRVVCTATESTTSGSVKGLSDQVRNCNIFIAFSMCSGPILWIIRAYVSLKVFGRLLRALLSSR